MRRSRLCPRCGGVIEAPDLEPGGATEGACPECGLGFSSSSLYSIRHRNLLGRRWGRRRRQRELSDHAAQRDAALRCRSFPIYGLDERWTGRRWAGGWGGKADAVDRIDLAHGDVHDETAPLVRVETLTLRHDPAGMKGVWAAQELAQHLWREGGDHEAVRPAFTSADPTASWADLTLPVDGQPTIFRLLATGASWVALGRIGECLVAIQARHIDPAGVGLLTVDDVGPYLADDGMPQ